MSVSKSFGSQVPESWLQWCWKMVTNHCQKNVTLICNRSVSFFWSTKHGPSLANRTERGIINFYINHPYYNIIYNISGIDWWSSRHRHPGIAWLLRCSMKNSGLTSAHAPRFQIDVQPVVPNAVQYSPALSVSPECNGSGVAITHAQCRHTPNNGKSLIESTPLTSNWFSNISQFGQSFFCIFRAPLVFLPMMLNNHIHKAKDVI